MTTNPTVAGFLLTGLSTLAGGTLITLALLWMTKSLVLARLKSSIKHEYDQRLESHKAELRAASETATEKLKSALGSAAAVEVERLRSALTAASLEHKIRFTELHAKRADAISSTYAHLFHLHEAISDYTAPFVMAGSESNEVRSRRAADAYNEFHKSYGPLALYFPVHIASQLRLIDTSIKKLLSQHILVVDVMESLKRDASPLRAKLLKELDLIRTALNSLEVDFRSALGDDQTGPRTQS